MGVFIYAAHSRYVTHCFWTSLSNITGSHLLKKWHWGVIRNSVLQNDICESAAPRCDFSANTRRSPKAGSMLAHRLRRWPIIEPILNLCFVFAGLAIQQHWDCVRSLRPVLGVLIRMILRKSGCHYHTRDQIMSKIQINTDQQYNNI